MTLVIPYWFWITFCFAFGCCVGSFLNVVIYRLPREKSLVSPPSSCPSCDYRIRFYDNIPLLSWLMLGGKCRKCKASISPRYFIIELLTGVVFVLTYYLYFHSDIRAGIPEFIHGGWLLYLITVILLSSLIASSAIDLELWIIPLGVCWLISVLGFIASAVAPLLIDPAIIRGYKLFPHADTKTAALAVGAVVGLAISMILLATGILNRSYELENEPETDVPVDQENEPEYNHRREALLEILFLLPIFLCAFAAKYITANIAPAANFWLDLLQNPIISGGLGAVYAYFIGCAIVWATRILGTLAFGKEAMGLGDVHLMGAAGAVVGPVLVVVAFFIAPFFGLVWALIQMFFRKTRQIPYGPFLSLGVISVIILNDHIYGYFAVVLGLE